MIYFDEDNPLRLINPAVWNGIEPEPQQYEWTGLLPSYQTTYLTGGGGEGKSTLGQGLAAHYAMCRPYLGFDTQLPLEGERVRVLPAIYLTFEDDERTLQQRQREICNGMGITEDALDGLLYLSSLVGSPENDFVKFGPDGTISGTVLRDRLKAEVRRTNAGLLILDNFTHLFPGDENNRYQVASFLAALDSFCDETGVTVLLLGHPNKSGDEFSGSTAFNNQVRSRLFLEIPKRKDGTIIDPYARTLTRSKSNNALPGEKISFRYHNGAFVTDDQLPSDIARKQVAADRDKADDTIFLKCLDERIRQNRAVSEKPGPNYAPTEFVRMSLGNKIGKDRYAAAMERLFLSNKIESGFIRRDTAKGRDIVGLRRVDCDPQTLPQTVPKHYPQTTPNAPKSTPKHTLLDTTYLSEGGPSGEAPSDIEVAMVQ